MWDAKVKYLETDKWRVSTIVVNDVLNVQGVTEHAFQAKH